MRKVIVLASALLLVTASMAFAQATVKAGEINLQFLTQIETDFEFRDNYDLDDARPHVVGDTRNGLFVESEIRLGMNASFGNWRAHVLLEQETLWDRNAEGNAAQQGLLTLERAWGEYNFGPFTLRAGPSEFFILDPAEIVYQDDDPMVRVYGKAGNVNWQFGWIRRQDDGGATAGTSSTAPTAFASGGAGGTASTRSRDHDIFHASATFPVKNGGISLDVTPFVLWNHDKQFGPTLSTVYLGAGAKGTIGQVAVLADFAFLTGTDDTGRNIVGAPAGTSVDVSAWAAFLSLAYPIPNTPLTIEVGGYWSSGDENPGDRDAEGFGAVQDTENLNPDGIWLDDDIRVVTAVTGTTVQVKADDDYITTLVGGGLTPQISADVEMFNLSNPGVQFYGVLLHYKATPELTVSGIYNHIRLMEGVTNVSTGACPASCTGVNITDKEMGNELAIRAVWKPEKYVTITPQLSYFLPGGGLQELVGKDEPAFAAIVEVFINF